MINGSKACASTFFANIPIARTSNLSVTLLAFTGAMVSNHGFTHRFSYPVIATFEVPQ